MSLEENITIAIPVFERYDFFEDAINSATNQTIPCKVIVVDNCSSHDKFETYVKKLNLINVTYFKNDENLGAIGNWNKCIDHCTTDWVSILHSDDMLSPYYIETVCALIKDNPNDNVFLIRNEVGENPQKIFTPANKIKYGRRLKPKTFLLGNYAGFPGNIFNKSKLSVKFEELKGASDYYFWYCLALNKPMPYIKNKLAFYRQSSIQDSANMDIEEVVIKPVYFVRKYKIGFDSKFMKALSMYELFDLYRFYQKSYNRNIENKFSFSITEINIYFEFYDNIFSKIILYPFYKLVKLFLKKFY